MCSRIPNYRKCSNNFAVDYRVIIPKNIKISVLQELLSIESNQPGFNMLEKYG